MNVKQTLDFLIANNVEIIQWLVTAILITFAGYLLWTLFRKAPAKEAESTEDIRKALKEVLEATRASAPITSPEAEPKAPVASSTETANPTPSVASAPAVDNSAETAKLQAQVEALRLELASKKESGAQFDPKELEDKNLKISELESKLAEYEILEDDIADLSLYKEENEKLKKQLAGLGLSVGETSASVEAPASEQAPVAEAASVPAPEPLSAPEAEPEAESEPFMESVESATGEAQEDFVAEFEAAVNVTKNVETTSEPKGSAPPREDLGGHSADDLMAEFEKSMSVAEGGSEPEPPAAETLDTEKMLEEMADLASLPTDENASSSLEESIDTEKMAAEASNLKE